MQANMEEAERRIEEARRTQAEILDLGDLSLGELPESLGDLPHLKALNLASIGPREEGRLQWVGYRESTPTFTDLAPLARLQGLQSLNLSYTLVTDLAPLAALQELQSLYLWFCKGVTDLAPLAGLQGLRSLDLDDTGVTDLTPLAGLQGLRGLNLRATKVTDLAPLAGLQGLQSLNLTCVFNMTDLAPLAGLQGLQSLDLSFTDVADLTPLARLQGLQSLKLRTTDCVTDLSPLAGLQGLQSLDLSKKARMDLSPLTGLQGLQSLNLYKTWVTDLAPLVELKGLQSLDLYGCRPPLTDGFLRLLADHPRLASLTAQEAAGVPREILSQEPEEDCLARLRAYYLAGADLAAAHAVWGNVLGPLYEVEQVKALLEVDSRQAVSDLAQHGRLLALNASGDRELYPAFQFGPDGRPYPEIVRVLEAFAGFVESLYTVASWFVTPQDLLDGETGAAWMRSRRDPERLRQAARRAATPFAR